MSVDPIIRLNAALEGRYHVERRLGEGGMATVYLAEDLRHERKVALKVLKPELAAVVGAERFLAEIKTTANLQHPHILPLHDSGEADGFLYFVMPYVEGDTLRDKLDREKQLGVAEAVTVVEKVAEALDYAHEHGVVHRDIKPGNILLSERGEPTIADFGIALAVAQAGEGRITETGLSVGTPHYMSPEQATGERDVDPRTDVYALGCVLYEMLVGRPPYTGANAQAVLAEILTGELVPPAKKRPTIPANVDGAIRKALEKLPADRFGSAEEFKKALGDPAFRHGESGPLATAPTVGPWKRVPIGVGALALLATGVAFWALTRRVPSPGVSRYSIALPDDQAYLQNEGWGRLAIAPDGSWFVYAGAGPQGFGQLWLRRRDQLTATPVPGAGQAINPAISPDGTRVAFLAMGGSQPELMVTTIGGGAPLLLDGSMIDSGGISWGYDGYIYYDGHMEGDGLARIPEGGGTPEAVTQPRLEDPSRYDVEPYALPNGRGVLFLERVAGLTFDIMALDLATGEQKVLVGGALAPRYAPTGHLLYVADDGTLEAAPFDEDALALTGPAVALADGVQLASGDGSVDLAIARDGTLIYRRAVGAALYQMVWADRDGTMTEIDPDWPPGNFGLPSLSPDGSELAVTVFGDSPQIWLKALDRGRFARLSLDGQSDGASWSSDGGSILFSSRLGDEPPAVYRRRVDEGTPAELVYRDEGHPMSEATLSPDGRWLVYRSAADIYGLRLDSVGAPEGDPIPLAARPFNELSPALSPDGRWLAYYGSESGRPEVYVCPFPSSCEARRLVSADGGTLPVWSHSGRELFYVGLNDQLMAVEVLPGASFDWGEVRALFDTSGMRAAYGFSGFDVSPDDQRFVFPRSVGAAQGELVVVENFFQELERLVPN